MKTANNEYRKTLVDYLNANLALTWKITPDLTFKTTGGCVLNKRRREEFNGSETYTGYAGSPSVKGVNGAIYWTDQTSWSNENTLDDKKRLGRSQQPRPDRGTLAPGAEERRRRRCVDADHLRGAGHRGHPHRQLPEGPRASYHDWRMMSACLRANYNFRYKYYLTFSFRADGFVEIPLRQPPGATSPRPAFRGTSTARIC